MSSWTPTNCTAQNGAKYNLALKQRGSLSIWFDAEMVWSAQSSGRRGRQQAYRDAAVQTCLTICAVWFGSASDDRVRREFAGVGRPGLDSTGIKAPSRQHPTDALAGQRTGQRTPCHEAIAARNAHAVIPPRKTAKLWTPPFVHVGLHCRAVDTPGARARNEAVRASKYLGRVLWRQLTGYQPR